MDYLTIQPEMTRRPRRNRAITDTLATLDRGLRGVRAEMRFGLQVDEHLVRELETRVKQLRAMAAEK